ncbi:MAG TPA: 4-hydroxy-tetrahydrodipicolinate reductase [Terriglobales bacterium]|jgi:4-hydroxy-tetrahydrodipicolinate reductase|nr:4-hydroxy-tetrahydrodipicolinate reductase [Terriglobales bacterium]
MALGIIVCGVGGRMGGAVVRALQQSADFKLAGAIDKAGSSRLGKDAGEIAAGGHLGIRITDKIDAALVSNSVIIDFTNPQVSLGFLRSAAKKRTPIVIATTGFNAKQQAEIKRLARRTPTLLAANTSLGVNVLVSLLGRAAKMLGDDYDVEIIEAHHRFKKDAPSGTALALGRSVADALGRDLEKVGINGRKGIVGERSKKEIALLSVRAGDIVGEHTVIFGGIGERLEFIHRAHSRDTFARGALRAARWLAKRKSGLYSMQDMLGLD